MSKRTVGVGANWACRWLAGMAGLGFLLSGCDQQPSSTPPPQNPPPAETAKADDAATAAHEEEPVVATPPAAVAPVDFALFREQELDLRLVSYNVLWNSIFEDVDHAAAARFRRVIKSLNPDVLALQEVGLHPEDRDDPNGRARTAEEVVALMNKLIPLGPDRTWHGQQGGDNVIVARYPLLMKRAKSEPVGDRHQALALVDLPDEQYPIDLYVMNNHYKCCGGNDDRRQKQSDAIVAWLRDARTEGGHIDLPPNTGIVICGDLNIVDGIEPVTTLLTGDIHDEATYGPDFLPDWDDTALTDLHPTHNASTDFDYTWRNDSGRYPPGRLDFIIYSDSTLDVAKHFVLNTALLTEAALKRAGLEEFDVTADGYGARYDHLPLVVDFRVK